MGTNFNKLLKGQSYNVPIKTIDENGDSLVLDGSVTFKFYTPEQLPIEAPINPNNDTINKQDPRVPSKYIEPLLISEGICYQDTSDSSIWFASITVPDMCKESQEGYEFYSLTFYYSYTKNNQKIQKEVQKLFTVYDSNLTLLTENKPYIFSYDSHLTGNILLPQPYEIEAVNIEVMNPKTQSKVYSKYIEAPEIYKQNEKYNIYTFMSGETIQTLREKSSNADQWVIQYSYTLKSQDSTGLNATMKQVYHLTNPVYFMSPKVAMLIKDLKFEIEKGNIFNIDQYLVWRDYDIYEALLLGLNRVNGTFPTSSVCYIRSLERIPDQLTHAVRLSALVELYKAWFLAEAMKKFDFQGMDISLSVDVTDAIRELIDLNNKWLDDNLSSTKKYITSNNYASAFRGTINYNTPVFGNICSSIIGINIF